MGLGIWNDCNKGKNSGKCGKGNGACGNKSKCLEPITGGGNCNNMDQELHCYHKMIQEGIQTFMNAQKAFLQATEKTEEGIGLLKSSKEGQLCGIKAMKEAEAYLCQANLQGQCNYCAPQCECLQKEMIQAFSHGMVKEQEALCLLEQALGKLCQAKQDYCCGEELTEKYIRCVHHKSC